MEYCEQNVSALTLWLESGVSACFLDTFHPLFCITLLSALGLVQFCRYRRFGAPIDVRLKPKSALFTLQLLLHGVVLVLPLVDLAIRRFALQSAVVHGSEIVQGCVMPVAWLVALSLLLVERHMDLPSPSAGHGVPLLLFWFAGLFPLCAGVASYNSPLWFWRASDADEKVRLASFLVGAMCQSALCALGVLAPGLASSVRRQQYAYGELADPESAGASASERSASEGSTFGNFVDKMKTLAPYLWPKSSFGLQLRVVLCFMVLVIGRVVNLYTPIFYKYIVNSLTYPPVGLKELAFRWDYIVVYSGLRFVQGGAMGAGLLNIARTFLWIPVQQYTTREISVQLYDHLHRLSLRWHIGRKTGEVLRVMDRGTSSIQSLLSYLLFNIIPTITDICIAIVFFISSFNAWFGLIVTVTMALYLAATIFVTEWRTKFRRQMNLRDNDVRTKGVDALLNFETVKYYNAESYEVERYRNSLLEYQKSEWLSQATLSLLNTVQSVVIGGGLLVGSLLCAYMVVEQHGVVGGFTVGDYVLFATYIMQLYSPLNFLGTVYRMIQMAFVDMENMFDLLKEKQEIRDVPDAEHLLVREGRIEFRNVSFGYDPQSTVLKAISFSVEPGQTVALVGPSGSGKSTIIRLIFRFYDVRDGEILIDGQNIALVKQKSLRQYIGVVPQDTVLFNDTIRYNIRYGRQSASDAEVEEAARAADIHDRIAGFTDGYDTMVGERGLKLSGGEKQRVAIARTILKSPVFVLLDEATSALDTHTERTIQASLNRICAGRTTVIVAHRLSTIIHADQILVIKDGEIVERGSHDDLLNEEGIYADMWRSQQTLAEEVDESFA